MSLSEEAAFLSAALSRDFVGRLLEHDPKKLQTFWKRIMRQNKETEEDSGLT